MGGDLSSSAVGPSTRDVVSSRSHSPRPTTPSLRYVQFKVVPKGEKGGVPITIRNLPFITLGLLRR